MAIIEELIALLGFRTAPGSQQAVNQFQQGSAQAQRAAALLAHYQGLAAARAAASGKKTQTSQQQTTAVTRQQTQLQTQLIRQQAQAQAQIAQQQAQTLARAHAVGQRFGGSIRGTFNAIGHGVINAVKGIAASALGINLSMAGMAMAVRSTTEEYDKLLKISERIFTKDKLKQGFKDIQEYGYVAKLSGGSVEGFASELEMLTQRLGEARRGSGRATAALQRFQIFPTKTSGEIKSGIEMFQELAAAFPRMEKAEQLDLASKLGLSRSSITMLQQGTAKTKELIAEARAFGLIVDLETAQASEKFNDSLTLVFSTLGAIKNRLVFDLLPVMSEYVEEAKKWYLANKDMVRQNVLQWVSNGIQLFKSFVWGVKEAKRILGEFSDWLEKKTGIGKPVTKGIFAGITLGLLAATGPIGMFIAGMTALLLILDDIRAFSEGRGSVIGDIVKWFEELGDDHPIKRMMKAFNDLMTSVGNLKTTLTGYFEAIKLKWNELLDALGIKPTGLFAGGLHQDLRDLEGIITGVAWSINIIDRAIQDFVKDCEKLIANMKAAWNWIKEKLSPTPTVTDVGVAGEGEMVPSALLESAADTELAKAQEILSRPKVLPSPGWGGGLTPAQAAVVGGTALSTPSPATSPATSPMAAEGGATWGGWWNNIKEGWNWLKSRPVNRAIPGEQGYGASPSDTLQRRREEYERSRTPGPQSGLLSTEISGARRMRAGTPAADAEPVVEAIEDQTVEQEGYFTKVVDKIEELIRALTGDTGDLKPDSQGRMPGDPGYSGVPGGPGSPGSGGTPTGPLAERIATAKAAMEDQLRKEGVPEGNVKEAANQMAGQAIAESWLNPNTVHDAGTGYGIYGARLGRRAGMFEWLDKNKFARDSLEGQSRYMIHEAMTNPVYAASRAALMSADPATRRAGMAILTRNFERPAKWWQDRTEHAFTAAAVAEGQAAVAGTGVSGGTGIGTSPTAAGIVNSRVGHRWGRFHAGTDWKGGVGTPVKARFGGVIQGVNNYGDVTVRNDDGSISVYRHISPEVSRGRVEEGQQIATIGPSGPGTRDRRSTGAHLHEELFRNGRAIDTAALDAAAKRSRPQWQPAGSGWDNPTAVNNFGAWQAQSAGMPPWARGGSNAIINAPITINQNVTGQASAREAAGAVSGALGSTLDKRDDLGSVEPQPDSQWKGAAGNIDSQYQGVEGGSGMGEGGGG